MSWSVGTPPSSLPPSITTFTPFSSSSTSHSPALAGSRITACSQPLVAHAHTCSHFTQQTARFGRPHPGIWLNIAWAFNLRIASADFVKDTSTTFAASLRTLFLSCFLRDTFRGRHRRRIPEARECCLSFSVFLLLLSFFFVFFFCAHNQPVSGGCSVRTIDDALLVKYPIVWLSPKMFNSDAADAQKEALAITRAHAEGLALGTRVECLYGNSSNYYWGKINWINEDGTFDILYEDGDQEFGVLRRLFRVDPGLQVGDLVQARSDEDNRFVEVGWANSLALCFFFASSLYSHHNPRSTALCTQQDSDNVFFFLLVLRFHEIFFWRG